jgi:hypothetical protein
LLAREWVANLATRIAATPRRLSFIPLLVALSA